MSSTNSRMTRSHHDWMAHGGFSPFHEESGCHTYARRLVRYISDPSTVRIRTLEMFGIAPSVEAIAKMRSTLMASTDARVEAARNYGLAYERTRIRVREKRRELRGLPKRPAPVAKKPEPIAEEPEAPVISENPTPADALKTAIDVIDACADYCGITHGELIGTSRKAPIVRARNLAAAVLRARGSSYPVIGKFLRRDHASVIHAATKFFERDIVDPQYLAAWEAMAPARAKHCRTMQDLAAVLVVRL